MDINRLKEEGFTNSIFDSFFTKLSSSWGSDTRHGQLLSNQFEEKITPDIVSYKHRDKEYSGFETKFSTIIATHEIFINCFFEFNPKVKDYEWVANKEIFERMLAGWEIQNYYLRDRPYTDIENFYRQMCTTSLLWRTYLYLYDKIIVELGFEFDSFILSQTLVGSFMFVDTTNNKKYSIDFNFGSYLYCYVVCLNRWNENDVRISLGVEFTKTPNCFPEELIQKMLDSWDIFNSNS